MTIFLLVVDIYLAYVFPLKYHPRDEVLESHTIRYILGWKLMDDVLPSLGLSPSLENKFVVDFRIVPSPEKKVVVGFKIVPSPKETLLSSLKYAILYFFFDFHYIVGRPHYYKRDFACVVSFELNPNATILLSNCLIGLALVFTLSSY